MRSFPPSLAFRLPWRSYQARVLEELSSHLSDNVLHVVAPPGSGKTVLGLEVARRLNKPTLIVSPTLTIRNQWVHRLTHLFLPPPQILPPAWVSMDLRKPGFLTSTTYQALNSARVGSRDGEKPGKTTPDPVADFASHLRSAGIETLVLDEAHHLKNEWWKTLFDLRSTLLDPTVVAVTATPPYDVSHAEWHRYSELCGPVDSEISVPELMRENDLCPHRDFVHFSTPSPPESSHIQEFKDSVSEFKERWLGDPAFVAALREHRWVQDPESFAEEILDNTAYFSSLVIFLGHSAREGLEGGPHRPNRDDPGHRDDHDDRDGGVDYANLSRLVGGGRITDLPRFDDEWLGILLTGCLFRDDEWSQNHQELSTRLNRDLRRMGAVQRRKVVLEGSPRIDKLLTSSANKLQSIAKIVELEEQTLGAELRMVVLSDYIRESALPRSRRDLAPLNQMGVVPIFESIRRKLGSYVCLGVLTGSVVILPQSAASTLTQIARRRGLEDDDLRLQPLRHDPAFVRVTAGSTGHHRMVEMVTELLAQGAVRVLVGTASLLGEGWDAPSINSLVLASVVGSFVTSNQMRGRAIRSQLGNSRKTANIWHLVCVEPEVTRPSHDFQILERRFKAFVGVTHSPDGPSVITNGIARLGLPSPPHTAQSIARLNAEIRRQARDRGRMRQEWIQALEAGDGEARMAERIEAPRRSVASHRRLLFEKTALALLRQGTLAGVAGLVSFVPLFFLTGGLWQLGSGAVCLAAFVAGSGRTLRAIRLLLRHGSPESSLRQMAVALLRSLSQIGAVKTDLARLKVRVVPHLEGRIHCYLQGGSRRESAVFLDAFQEILDPVENPRYLMVRESTWRGSFFLRRRQRFAASKARFAERVKVRQEGSSGAGSSFLAKVRRRSGSPRRAPEPQTRGNGWFQSLHVDYHSVPRLMGQNKAQAQLFARTWQKYVGSGKLVYTRTPEGRGILLRARLESLSAAFQKKADRIRCWR